MELGRPELFVLSLKVVDERPDWRAGARLQVWKSPGSPNRSVSTFRAFLTLTRWPFTAFTTRSAKNV
jgi:hypothetical protein